MLKSLRGIGPVKENKLKKLGITTIQELIEYYPRTYEDRSKEVLLQDSREEPALFHLRIDSAPMTRKFGYKRAVSNFLASDESGRARISFWHHPYARPKLSVGESYYFFGKAELQYGEYSLSNPIFERTKTGTLGSIVSVYPVTEGLTSNELRGFVKEALQKYADELRENLPEKMIENEKLMNRKEAMIRIHFPRTMVDIEEARRRLEAEELFYLKLAMERMKAEEREDLSGRAMSAGDVETFLTHVPFEPTGAQRNALQEVSADLASPTAMRRLLQGDVGSGKTLIAFFAAWKAVMNGHQAVLMAPTEILARQHYDDAKAFFQDTVRVGILTGSLSPSERDATRSAVACGEIDFLIATHAAIEDSVEFCDLAQVTVDEQHRFGVTQRLRLAQKGNTPDVLVMSATPIPRSLALILYGDMDISVIDELPKGRQKVKTYVVDQTMEERVMRFVKKEVAAGGQVYIVCPLIEDSEKMDLKSAENLYKRLKGSYLQDLRVALLHGRMKKEEKDGIMKAFVTGDIDVLISTTVIEVGVNVPNANLMIIYNAERFGLSQLHQLRGRVGRSDKEAIAILFHLKASLKSAERMRIIASSNDGFYIAKRDMEERGIGDFFGTRQSGMPLLKFPESLMDAVLIDTISHYVEELRRDDSGLANHPVIRECLERYMMMKVGV